MFRAVVFEIRRVQFSSVIRSRLDIDSKIDSRLADTRAASTDLAENKIWISGGGHTSAGLKACCMLYAARNLQRTQNPVLAGGRHLQRPKFGHACLGIEEQQPYGLCNDVESFDSGGDFARTPIK